MPSPGHPPTARPFSLGGVPARKWTEVRASAGGWLGRFAGETYRAASDVRALMPPRDFVAGPVRAARIN